MELNSEAWAAIWGGIVGAVVGGLISLAIQLLVLRQAAKDRRRQRDEERHALGQSLFLKMLRISSNLSVLHRHLEGAFASAPSTSHEEPFLFVLPLASHPAHVQISEPEMGLVLGLGDDELTNKILPFEAIHNDTIDLFKTFATMKKELKDLMPATMNGNIGTTTFTEEQMKTVRPKMVEVNMLIEQMRPRVKGDFEESRWILERLHPALTEKAGFKMKVEFKTYETATDAH